MISSIVLAELAVADFLLVGHRYLKTSFLEGRLAPIGAVVISRTPSHRRLTFCCDNATLMPVMQHASNPIQDVLQQRNISLRRLAADAGISPSTLSRWASGKQTPSPQCCRKFAESLLLPVEEVLIWAGHLAPQQKTGAMEFPDLKNYVKKKYSAESQEDMAAMIEDLLPECYPSPYQESI